MSQHPGKFIAESPVPVAEALPAGVESNSAPAAAKRRRLRPLLFASAGLLALAGGGYFGWNYWMVGRFGVSTDDAYVQADNSTIAPKVSGYIAAVLVGDNQPVKAGQTIAVIDDRDFRVALDQAKADVAAADAAIAIRQATLEAQKSAIAAARGAADVAKANLTFAGQENQRYASLAATGYGSVQNAQQASSRIAASRAAAARDSATLDSAIRQVDVMKAELVQAEAARAHSQAVQEQAELNLTYATITSPVDGVVGARTLRIGQYVQAGTQLMAVVPVASAYIVANFKETQLAGVRAGQSVDVEIDGYPGQSFRGRVDSIAPASGQEFALLPPDNATGNFTKIVQRVPVRITLDAALAADILRPGMSVSPTIDTKPAASSTLANRN